MYPEQHTPSVNTNNATASNNRILDEQGTSITDSDERDNIHISSSVNPNNCSNNIVAYIAGLVVFRLKKLLNCELSINALRDSQSNIML